MQNMDNVYRTPAGSHQDRWSWTVIVAEALPKDFSTSSALKSIPILLRVFDTLEEYETLRAYAGKHCRVSSPSVRRSQWLEMQGGTCEFTSQLTYINTSRGWSFKLRVYEVLFR